jgi:hypothetical protein
MSELGVRSGIWFFGDSSTSSESFMVIKGESVDGYFPANSKSSVD